MKQRKKRVYPEPAPDALFQCKWCERLKPRTAFQSTLCFRGPRRRSCKECINNYHRRRYAENRVERRAYLRAREAATGYSRLRRHGLTAETYNAMLTAQGNRCAICRKEFTNRTGKTGPCIDHCHATGRVRGILCAGCNTGLGNFYESPETMAAAAQYIQAHKVALSASA